MTKIQCDLISDQLLEAAETDTEISTSSSDIDLFYRAPYYKSVEVIVPGRFGTSYQKPASQNGRYPTATDLNNIFSTGIRHGFRRLFCEPNIWREDSIQTLKNFGYPGYSVVMDENYNEYLGLTIHNTAPLPQDGSSNKNWVKFEPKAGFHRVNPSPNHYLGRIYFDVTPPYSITTQNILVKKFTGRDIGFSGVVQFLDLNNRNSGPIADENTAIYVVPPKDQVYESSIKLKISTYEDIYENEEHTNDFIEVLSYASYSKWENNSIRYWQTRSPHKLVPISLDTTYYLYMELVNSCVKYTGYPNYGICALFYPRTLYWPGYLRPK